MKKTILLLFTAMTMLTCACSGTGQGVREITGYGASRAIASPPASLDGNAHRGVAFSVSDRSSVKIDVEGILDYMQGASVLTTDLIADYHLDPWISWNVSF